MSDASVVWSAVPRFASAVSKLYCSGVISNADLAASKAGLQMYKDIQQGRFKTITDYVSPAFCEEINLNDYTPEMKRIVENNGRH